MGKPMLVLATGTLLALASCTSSSKTLATTAGATETVVSTAAGARGTGISSTDMSDAAFLIEAASSGQMEVELGEMAIRTAASPEVKQFGQMMVEHHSKANQELKLVAAALGVELPTSLTQMHREMADKLKGRTKKSFDEGYMDLMEKAHRRDVDMFIAKTTSAEDAGVKDFAVKTLPLLRTHLEMAGKIEKKVD